MYTAVCSVRFDVRCSKLMKRFRTKVILKSNFFTRHLCSNNVHTFFFITLRLRQSLCTNKLLSPFPSPVTVTSVLLLFAPSPSLYSRVSAHYGTRFASSGGEDRPNFDMDIINLEFRWGKTRTVRAAKETPGLPTYWLEKCQILDLKIPNTKQIWQENGKHCIHKPKLFENDKQFINSSKIGCLPAPVHHPGNAKIVKSGIEKAVGRPCWSVVTSVRSGNVIALLGQVLGSFSAPRTTSWFCPSTTAASTRSSTSWRTCP